MQNQTLSQSSPKQKTSFIPGARAAAIIVPEFNLAKSLGIVSILLGAVEVALTRPAAQAAGLDEKYVPVMRAFGLREIFSGIGLLRSGGEKKWLWSRVIGDVMDSAFLGYAFFTERDQEKKKKIALTFAVISPIVLADLFSVLRPNNAR